MSGFARAARALDRDQRLAALAALALIATMLLPWYGLEHLDRARGRIYAHDVSALGEPSFLDAAIVVVAASVLALLLARGQGRAFRLPGGDGTVIACAGAWAGVLVFIGVFDRPGGGGYPVGVEWGVFLAFIAAGGLAAAGLRMRSRELPGPPLRRARAHGPPPGHDPEGTIVLDAPGARRSFPAVPATRRSPEPRAPAADPAPSTAELGTGAPAPDKGVGAKTRPRYPPAPAEQRRVQRPR